MTLDRLLAHASNTDNKLSFSTKDATKGWLGCRLNSWRAFSDSKLSIFASQLPAVFTYILHLEDRFTIDLARELSNIRNRFIRHGNQLNILVKLVIFNHLVCSGRSISFCKECEVEFGVICLFLAGLTFGTRVRDT